MVLGRKTNFFLGKRWFWADKPTFSYEKPKKPSFGKLTKTIFLESGPVVSQKKFFFGFLGFF